MECRLVAHSANYRERMRALMKTHNLNSKHDSIRARSMNSQLRRSVLPRTLYARTTCVSHQGVNLRSKSKLQAAYVSVQPLIGLGRCRVASCRPRRGGRGTGSGGRGRSSPSRDHGAFARRHAVVPVPDEARLALASRLALPPAGSCLLVVLARPPAWGPTRRVVRTAGTVHPFAFCDVLPVYCDSSSAAFSCIGIQRVTVALV